MLTLNAMCRRFSSASNVTPKGLSIQGQHLVGPPEIKAKVYKLEVSRGDTCSAGTEEIGRC